MNLVSKYYIELSTLGYKCSLAEFMINVHYVSIRSKKTGFPSGQNFTVFMYYKDTKRRSSEKNGNFWQKKAIGPKIK